MKEEIIESLREDSISNIDDALKFLEEQEAEEVIAVDWKWEVRFRDDTERFKFDDDVDLIEWCREQRDTYFSDD